MAWDVFSVTGWKRPYWWWLYVWRTVRYERIGFRG